MRQFDRYHPRKTAVAKLWFEGRSMIGRIEGCTVKGAITVLQGTKKNIKTTTHGLVVGGEPQSAGPFEIEARSPKSGKEVEVRVRGDLALLKEVKVKNAQGEVRVGVLNWFGRLATVSCPASEGEGLEVELTYWADLKEIPIPFEIVVGAVAK